MSFERARQVFEGPIEGEPQCESLSETIDEIYEKYHEVVNGSVAAKPATANFDEITKGMLISGVVNLLFEVGKTVDSDFRKVNTLAIRDAYFQPQANPRKLSEKQHAVGTLRRSLVESGLKPNVAATFISNTLTDSIDVLKFGRRDKNNRSSLNRVGSQVYTRTTGKANGVRNIGRSGI